jgi:hypothetical protein
MHIVKLFATVAALIFSGAALADASFVCGPVPCSAFGTGVITGIDDLVVDGDHFDVTFSHAQDSTFAFSYFSSLPGQTVTGVDAANALDAFYDTQHGPIPQDDGPGIIASVDGVTSVVFNIVTAVGPTSSDGVVAADITEPFLGGVNHGPISVAPDAGDGSPGPGQVVVSHANSAGLCSFATCTKWTLISAPEVSPSSAISALTLLLGILVVLRGRRRPSHRVTARLTY